MVIIQWMRYPILRQTHWLVNVCTVLGILNITFRGLYRANSVVVNWSYPLVNVYVTNWKDPPFSSWVNPLFLWPLSIAMLVYQRVNVVFLDIF